MLQAQDKVSGEVLDTLHAVGVLLNTGLDKTTLALCASLIEGGAVNPLALAAIVKESRRVGNALAAEGTVPEAGVRDEGATGSATAKPA